MEAGSLGREEDGVGPGRWRSSSPGVSHRVGAPAVLGISGRGVRGPDPGEGEQAARVGPGGAARVASAGGSVGLVRRARVAATEVGRHVRRSAERGWGVTSAQDLGALSVWRYSRWL